MAYGSTICDWKLVKLSAFNEIVSLIFCVAVGVVIGAITGKNIVGRITCWENSFHSI